MVGIASHVMMSWVTRYVDASRSALYLLAFNIVSVGLAWPIHDEPVTLPQFVGGAIVLAAVAAVVSRPATTAPTLQGGRTGATDPG
jgi:drug/metabolite transporter (DMT)-like permease